MLSRSARLHQRADFSSVTRAGRRVGAAGLVLHALVARDATDRKVGFVEVGAFMSVLF